MKKNLHPEYTATTVSCTCGNTFTTRSTAESGRISAEATLSFLGVGVLYDRMHTREIADYGGVAHIMPRFALLYMLFTMASVGLPGTSGFVGEFLAMLGAFRSNPWVAFFATFLAGLRAVAFLAVFLVAFLGGSAAPASARRSAERTSRMLCTDSRPAAVPARNRMAPPMA